MEWHIFGDVGGVWRYLDANFDSIGAPGPLTNACGRGASPLTASPGDCFRFDNTPWHVSVVDGTPIHVALGGFVRTRLDGYFCRHDEGCDPSDDLAACSNAGGG
jgi:hypothetical protein